MKFPLHFTFKVLALSPSISVTDATGATVFFVKQKLFRLKEHVNIFSDSTCSRQVATIKADRIIDWSAKYGIAGEDGQLLGGLGRKGARSIWRAHYEVFGATGAQIGTIQEENPWAKVMDNLLSEIPIMGALSGFFFHPSYLMTDANGAPILRLHKRPAFLEGKFEVAELVPSPPEETELRVLAFLMLTLLERARG